MKTEVIVGFEDKYADMETTRPYFDVMDRYGALGVGHSDGTYSLYMPQEKVIDIEKLRKDLKDIPIIDVRFS